MNPEVQLKLFRSLLPKYYHERINIADTLGIRYKKIIQSIQEIAPKSKLILMIPYHPHYHFNLLQYKHGCGAKMINYFQYCVLTRLVTPLVQQILFLAKNYKLNVIDLSKTFNPNLDCHYGTEDRNRKDWSGAEPSNKSSQLMAELVSKIIQVKNYPPSIFFGQVNVNHPEKVEKFLYSPLTDFNIANYTFGA